MGRVNTLTGSTEVRSELAPECSFYQDLHEALVDMCTLWDMRRQGMRGSSEGAGAHADALVKVVGLLLADSLDDAKDAQSAAVRLDKLDNIQQDWIRDSYSYSDVYETHLARCRLDVQQLLDSFGYTLP